DARRILAAIRGGSVSSVNSVIGVGNREVSRRDPHANVFGGGVKADYVQRVVDLLVQHHYLHPVEMTAVRAPGRPPSPRYFVNPAVFTGPDCAWECPPQNSQNSQNVA